MSPREKKELVGYLKKEAKRLRNAIKQAEEKNNYGKAEHHKQSLEAYQKFLENVYSASKKSPLLLLPIIFFLFSSFSFIAKNDPALSGKMFLIELIPKGKELFSQPVPYYISFNEGKLYSKPAGKEKQIILISGFAPGYYSRMIDSSVAETVIIFASMSKKRSGETLLWQGSITNKKIQGFMHWSGGEKGYKMYSFMGELK